MINIKLLIRLFAVGVKRRPAPEDCDQRAAESEVGRQRVLWSLWLQGDSGGDLDDDHDHLDEGDDNVEPLPPTHQVQLKSAVVHETHSNRDKLHHVSKVYFYSVRSIKMISFIFITITIIKTNNN